MRMKEMGITFCILTALIVFSCSKRAAVPVKAGSGLQSGNCAGCLMKSEEDLFSFVVRTEADYESLTAHCFLDRVRGKYLPPRPGDNEALLYVSLEGGGCQGCLDIVNVRETSQNIVVEVEGGFQGNCEMLIVLGAWVIIPETDKPVEFQLREVMCPGE